MQQYKDFCVLLEGVLYTTRKSLAFLLWLRFRLFLLAHPYRIWADSGLYKKEMVLIG